MVPVIFNSSMQEIGPVPYIELDCETGDSSTENNVEITSSLPDDAYGVAVLGTDVGCIIEYVDAISCQIPTLKGWSWSGLLTQIVLVPPSGSDYLTISDMDLNRAIESVLTGQLGGFFSFPSEDAGITVSFYQFELYTDALTGLMAMCKSVGAKLVLHAEKDESLGKVVVYAEGKANVTYEETFDEDSQLQLEFIQNRMGYTHMICMGKGELQERLKYELYLQEDGTFDTKKPYTGFLDRQYYYDDNNADSHTKLHEDAVKKFPDIAWSTTLKIKKAPDGLEVGDIVKGKHGSITVESMVNKKIVKFSGGRMTTEYSVKENK